uniref:RPW8 domain-containing protein n=1 Tax=Fagus sylvatica TaxID=28930 RepID=A0A2N9GDK7_FAGSY
MAEAFVGGALLGAAFGEAFTLLHDTVKSVGSKALMSNSIVKNLASNLNDLASVVEEIRQLSEDLDLPEEETKSLIEKMNKAKELISEWSKFPWWKRLFKGNHGKELTSLNEEIERFCKVVMPAQSRRDGLKLLKEFSIQTEKIRGLSCSVPRPPDFTVGLDVPLKELKTLLMKEEESLLLLTAAGGCGKTTLVQMLGHDEEIKGIFGEGNIFYVTISKTPNLKVTVQRLFHHVGVQVPEFQSDEDAINHLQELPKQVGSNPMLLILDDVWPGSEPLLEKFKFHMPKSKILVTTRTAFPRFSFTYNLKPLNAEDAMALFRYSASLKDGTSCIPDEDIEKVMKGCGGFPLALEVIGGSLRGQPAEVQLSRVRKWTNNRFIYNPDLLVRLQSSLEFSDDEVTLKECFMDLGSFPEDQRIPVPALIDMWAELYEPDEDGINAIANLHELTTRNLANLVRTSKDASKINNYYNEDFVTQHDLLRELAMYESSQGPEGQRQRLIMDISGDTLPNWCTEQDQQFINAHLLSISTDESFLSSWCNIQAPKVEVLVLNFQTKTYSLPKFVDTMDKLKAFGSCTIQVSDALPNLMEINIDYCNDLVELPTGLCEVILLKKLSITNCHKLSTLPKGIGMLVNLEVLRLRSCTDLSELPDSIRSLHKLRILDISDCLSIKHLPKHIERAKLWEPIKQDLTNLEVKVAEKNINLSWLLKS